MQAANLGLYSGHMSHGPFSHMNKFFILNIATMKQCVLTAITVDRINVLCILLEKLQLLH